MHGISEYQLQDLVRSSDTATKAFTSSETGTGISSATWSGWAEKFDSGAKMFGAVSVATATSKDPRIQAISKAAALTSAIAKALADLARQKAEEAKAKEKQAAERRAFEKHLREGMDKSMRDHMDKMSRGEYKDPPSRERLAEIGRMA